MEKNQNNKENNDQENEFSENNEEYSNSEEEYQEEETNQTNLLQNILQDRKKLILIVVIVIFFFSSIYLIFFKQSKPKNIEQSQINESQALPEKEKILINENALNNLPEIKTPELNISQNKIEDILLNNNDQILIEKPIEPIKQNITPPTPPEKPQIKENKNESANFALPLPNAIPNNQNNSTIITLEPSKPNIQPNSPIINNPNSEDAQRKRMANVLVFANSSNPPDKKDEVLRMINGKTKTKKSGFNSISESYTGLKDRMILTGKIIDLVLESSINTEQDGILRAIVASDVYSESGFNILIPAGSRVLGNYKGEIKYGNFRVNILFNRIIRPDGVDIMLGDMKAINKLGASGIRADKVDNRLGAAFGNSMVIGALSLAALYASRQIDQFTRQDDRNLSNNSNQGNGTSISINLPGLGNNNNDNNDNSKYKSTTQDIIDKSVDPLKNHIEKMQNNLPILIVNQGRKVSMMVDKDIVFNDENAFVFYPNELDELGIK